MNQKNHNSGNEWKKYKWGDLATLEYGKGLGNYLREDGKYPVYGTNGRIGTTDNLLCPFPSIVVGRKGAYRGIHYSKTPFYVIDTAFFLNPKIPDLDITFAYYQLLTVDINYMDSGSAIPSTSREDFYDIDIFLPPINEQRSIASILSSLDDKIDLLHRQNKTLEQLAETLFRQWFVEEADENWVKGLLEDFVNIAYGKNLPTSKLLKRGYPVFGGNGRIGFYDKFLYELPQVLVSCRGEASGVVNISLPKSFVTNNSLVLEIKDNNITFEFLKYFSLFTDFKVYITGSAQPQITIETLKQADFFLPPLDLINRFSNLVGDYEIKRSKNKIQIQVLTQLRDTLLPKLISGEVRVKI